MGTDTRTATRSGIQGLFQQLKGLGSGILLRQVLKQGSRLEFQLKEMNRNLAQLCRAVERIVPPPPDTTPDPLPVPAHEVLSGHDDHLLAQYYQLQEDLVAKWGRNPDMEEVVEEYERRVEELEVAEQRRQMAQLGGER